MLLDARLVKKIGASRRLRGPTPPIQANLFAMARHSETFTLPRSVAKAKDICVRVFDPVAWRYLDDRVDALMVVERVGIIQRFFSYPTKFAVFLREDGKRKTTVELHSATFGFGPLPKYRLRRKTAEIKNGFDMATNEPAK